jgi:serine/threonine-protein kinase
MSESVPRYDMRRLVATGGMGRVWAAHDTVLDRDVAVKVLKDEYADDSLFRDRFAAEARHAAQLQHPNVAAVLDYGELPTSAEHPTPRPYLVMELVEGEPLSALLKQGRPMPPETAADIVGQAALGVAAAHRAGIVHRDVKPGNLLVTPQGAVKVTDFGIARAADAVPLTGTGQVMGTPHYLSPEQAEGKAATPASDVYGLGIVLFECLTGTKPHDGDSPVATALQHLDEPLPELPERVPAWLRSVVQRATAKDPDQRYPDAATLATALAEASQAPAAASDLATSVLPAGSAAATRIVAGRPATTPPRRTAPVGTILAGLAALVLAGLLAWAVLDGAGEDPSTVQVEPDDYVDRSYDEAASDLDAEGLEPTREERTNPGDQTPDEVAAVRPTGTVEQGAAVVLTVWGPTPEAERAPEPLPEPVPTEEPEPTPSVAVEPTRSSEPVPDLSVGPDPATDESASGDGGSGSGSDPGGGG